MKATTLIAATCCCLSAVLAAPLSIQSNPIFFEGSPGVRAYTAYPQPRKLFRPTKKPVRVAIKPVGGDLSALSAVGKNNEKIEEASTTVATLDTTQPSSEASVTSPESTAPVTAGTVTQPTPEVTETTTATAGEVTHVTERAEVTTEGPETVAQTVEPVTEEVTEKAETVQTVAEKNEQVTEKAEVLEKATAKAEAVTEKVTESSKAVTERVTESAEVATEKYEVTEKVMENAEVVTDNADISDRVEDTKAPHGETETEAAQQTSLAIDTLGLATGTTRPTLSEATVPSDVPEVTEKQTTIAYVSSAEESQTTTMTSIDEILDFLSL